MKEVQTESSYTCLWLDQGLVEVLDQVLDHVLSSLRSDLLIVFPLFDGSLDKSSQTSWDGDAVVMDTPPLVVAPTIQRDTWQQS